MFKARVYVTLKPGVLDPQGEAVQHALGNLGYRNVERVRIGKLIEMEITAADGAAARAAAEEMARRLLANPVLEEFSVEIEETGR